MDAMTSPDLPAAAVPALELDGLTKTFNETRAADGVSLTVPRGAMLGLVGPNGAGKTTSLSMAVGLLRPDSGTARVLGVDVWRDPVEAKKRLGVLPDGLSLPERLTGGELLDYWGRLRGLGRDITRSRAEELLKVLELDGSRKDAGLVVGTYRYVVSTLSLPLRMMAYVVGFGGGRERGIATLQQTAAAEGEARTDALFALVLIFNRERRYDDALQALQQLRQLYPRNRLVVLEQGSTALRAGRPAQADTVLSEGLTALARDGMTMMLVTHEIGFARKVADRVVFMHQGRIWEQGRAAETLAGPRTPELEVFLSAVLH